ncbi:hypothetical protein JCM19238_261 [Vibrio ponticus]|nr:hypothetical protein JCM19238_261 [Vibrio ponticus]
MSENIRLIFLAIYVAVYVWLGQERRYVSVIGAGLLGMVQAEEK